MAKYAPAQTTGTIRITKVVEERKIPWQGIALVSGVAALIIIGKKMLG